MDKRTPFGNDLLTISPLSWRNVKKKIRKTARTTLRSDAVWRHFAAMLYGDIELSQLSDEEARIFADVLAVQKDSPSPGETPPRKYIQSFLDSLDRDLYRPEIPPGFVESNAPLQEGSKKAHIPDKWKPMHQIIKENCGNNHLIKALVMTFYKGAPPRDKCVKQTTGGHIYISSKYEKFLKENGLLRPLELAAEFADPSWRSAKSLCESREITGGSAIINNKFIAFREEQIACLQAMGQPRDKAEKWVEENWIGTYRKENGGPEALFASPEAIEAMKQQEVLKLQADAAPPADSTRISASGLEQSLIYVGAKTLQKRLWGTDKNKYDLKSVFGQLVGDIATSLKISELEALQFALDNLACLQKPKKGQEATHFSMDLVRVAVNEGILRRKDCLMDIPDAEMRLADLRRKAKDASLPNLPK